MKRLFSVAVLALSASVGFADDKPAAGATTVPPAAPVVVAPAYQPAPSTGTRRGLFGRLRNRGATSYSAPQMAAPIAAPVVVPAPTPAPATVPAPMTAPQPMPGSKPVGAMTVPGTVVPTAGTYTTAEGDVVQVGGPVMESQPVRRGLFGRMRSR